MKRFKFNLENLLNSRITVESQAKNTYHEAMRLLNLERDRLLSLENSRKKLMQSYNIEAGTVVSPDAPVFLARYTSQLLHLIRQQKQILRENENLTKKKFEEWNHKRKDVKVLEQLKTKKWEEYLKKAEKEEQQFQDEIFIAKKIREREVAA